MVLIYQNNNGKAEYDESTQTLRTQYVGIANPDTIKDLLRKVIEYASTSSIKHMIANLSQMQGTFTGALEFFETEFYPKMILHGLNTYAMVVSNDVFTKFSANQLNKKVGDKLSWHAFSNLKEAEEWTYAHSFHQ